MILRRYAFAGALAAIICAQIAVLVSCKRAVPESSGVVGTWTGAVRIGGQTLRLVVHVSADSTGKLRVSMDSIDQGASAAGDNAVLKDGRFSFEIPSAKASYMGTLSGDRNTINGELTQGVPMPLVFTRLTSGPLPTVIPTPTPAPAMPPVTLDHLKAALDRELAPVLEHGVLSPQSGGGLVVGVLDHDQRLIFAYGTAKPDSIFEIGSITKTFTGLALAQMVVQKKVMLDEPIRMLLPPGFVAKPDGGEITLLDLATHHSGLPRMPDNFNPRNPANPYADYGGVRLHEFLTVHGVAKPANAAFLYSNLAFELLGYGLSLRADLPYRELVSIEITGPLRLSDTVVTLSPEQRVRLIQGYDTNFHPVPPWDWDAYFGGSGALKSTAADLLTYLDANLHPEKYATGAAADSPAATLPAAIAIDHLPRADMGDNKIALAWWFYPKIGTYLHGGATSGYNSFVAFNLQTNGAIVVLYNRVGADSLPFVERVAVNIGELLLGIPSIPLDVLSVDERRALSR
ncbi:MAG: serine hydrolase domain-containing protein [Candidatus Binataceae bacterium]